MTGLMPSVLVSQLLLEQLKGRSIVIVQSCLSRQKRIRVSINDFWAHTSATCCLGCTKS